MNQTLPPVYLYRDRVFILPGKTSDYGTEPVDRELVVTALVNLSELGYTFSPALLQRCLTLSKGHFKALYAAILPVLRERKGAHKRYRPMYPDFPRQVMEAPLAELWLNAILHYWFGLLPDYDKTKRPPLDLPPFETMTVLDYGTNHELGQLPRDLLASKSSLTPTEREALTWFFKTFGDNSAVFLPPEIPFKENLAYAANLVLTHTKLEPEVLRLYVKTATDVLRIAAGLSGADVSLAAAPKFRSFKRRERRLLLSLLEAIPNPLEDIDRYPEIWKRLAHGLHVGELKEQYPNAYTALSVVRQGLPVITTGRIVEEALRKGDLVAALDRLKIRPGELARRLDHLLRLSQPEKPLAQRLKNQKIDPRLEKLLQIRFPDEEVQHSKWHSEQNAQRVLDLFEAVAPQVSTPVLLQVLSHFKARGEEEPAELRSFFPKGNVAKIKTIENKLPELPAAVTETVVSICRHTLFDRFRALPELGRVYVDEKLKSYLVPLTGRANSKALRTLTRGTRIPFPADFGTTIRFFLWWKEGETADGEHTGRVDLDLSATLFDAAWNYKDVISYYNLRDARYKGAHSGDITSAPNGACEFIDLDIASVLKFGGRYVVMSVNGYTQQPFNKLPECFAGWMMREKPDSGEIFEASTVRDKVDLASDTTIALPVILDLEAREVIWTDLGLKRNLAHVNNVAGNKASLNAVGRAMTSLRRPDLYELFSLHAAARGQLVADPDRADTVFGTDYGTLTAFDQEKIRAEYL
jgi:hypothetical protein